MSKRGRTIGDFLGEVFEFCTENWLVILIVAGLAGYGPCASAQREQDVEQRFSEEEEW